MYMNGIFRALSAYGLVAGLFSLLFFGGDIRWVLFGCGQMAFPALLGLPSLMSRKIRITDPLTFIALPMTVGTVLGSMMIAFGEGKRRNAIMADWAVPDFAQGMIFMLLSLIMISLGYCATTKRIPVERYLPDTRNLSERGIQLGLLIGVGIALLSIASYLQSTGGFSLSAISQKRAIEIASEGEVVYGGGGYVRLLAGISDQLLLLLLAYHLQQSATLRPGIRFQLIAVFLLAAFLPFVSSGRGALVMIFYGLLFVYTAYRDLRWSQVIGVAAIPLVIFGIMTGLRAESQGGEGGFVNPLMALPESGNGLHIGSTTAVLNAVPERMPFQYGATMTSWVFAPIPRTVWPTKPDTSLGKRIKAEIYQRKVIRTGNPASFMAEGFMNFGWIGFFGVSLAFGALARLTANSFLPAIDLRRSPLAPVLYFMMVMAVASLTNSNLSQAIIRLITDVVSFTMAYVLLRYLIARRVPHMRLSGQRA